MHLPEALARRGHQPQDGTEGEGRSGRSYGAAGLRVILADAAAPAALPNPGMARPGAER
jgi:hypothetical protein